MFLGFVHRIETCMADVPKTVSGMDVTQNWDKFFLHINTCISSLNASVHKSLFCCKIFEKLIFKFIRFYVSSTENLIHRICQKVRNVKICPDIRFTCFPKITAGAFTSESQSTFAYLKKVNTLENFQFFFLAY